MKPIDTLLKAILVAACLAGAAGTAFAAQGDTAQADPKVDCKKSPNHPDCDKK